MKSTLANAVLASGLAVAATAAQAHFAMVMPSDSMVSKEDGRDVAVTLSFSHPFERIGMTLETPELMQREPSGEMDGLINQLV